MSVLIRFNDTTSTTIDKNIIHIAPPTRIKRSLQMFGILILAATGSILIPVMHFFLVPSLFISAFVMSYLRYHQTSYIDLTGFPCPKCQTALNLKKVYQTENIPFSRVVCTNCDADMKIGSDSQ
jgi:hypothetical protein